MPDGVRRKLIYLSFDIMRKRKKYKMFFLFLEVVTLTFALQTSLSTGFIFSPSGI
jgi:hypothetical protein